MKIKTACCSPLGLIYLSPLRIHHFFKVEILRQIIPSCLFNLGLSSRDIVKLFVLHLVVLLFVFHLDSQVVAAPNPSFIVPAWPVCNRLQSAILLRFCPLPVRLLSFNRDPRKVGIQRTV